MECANRGGYEETPSERSATSARCSSGNGGPAATNDEASNDENRRRGERKKEEEERVGGDGKLGERDCTTAGTS